MRTFSPLPLPLWSASVVETLVMHTDGSSGSVLRFAVTPMLLKHAVLLAGGDAMHVTFAEGQVPPVDHLLVGAAVAVTDGVGVGQAPRRITDYVGVTRTARITPAWGTPPDATSHGVLAWPSFAPFGGFLLEKALVVEGSATPFYPVATVPGTDYVMPTDDGPYTAQFRFTPVSLANVHNGRGRWVVTVEVQGAEGPPDPPLAPPGG